MPQQNDKLGPSEEYYIGGAKLVVVEHFGPASYDATNKEVLKPQMFGLSTFFAIQAVGPSVTNSTGAIYGDVRPVKPTVGNWPSTYKLTWYSNITGTEVTNATDLSGRRVTLLVFGV